MMLEKNFNPWKNFENYSHEMFSQMSSELVQWPVKLWKAPIVSPYYHKAHLLIAADCSAFSYPPFHEGYSKGKVPLICCPETDFDIMTKLSRIFLNNDIQSVTLVKMDKSCCHGLTELVMQAIKSSRIPVPLQVSTIFVDAEDME